MAGNMDLLGQKFGEYRLLRWLGGGGCGEVYLGESVRDQTLAAVKVLHARLTESGELKTFINEARAIRLKHPNIVPLLDFGIGTNDIPFLIMEYAPHGTLRTLHPKGSRLPLSTIMTYVNPIASALQYAHDSNLVHRDVKPENMLIGADSQILLSDFGLATVAFSSQGQESISGTIPYMAPEQFEGKPQPASDQYALAIVVYEWLSGVRPFQGTTNEVAMQHRLADPRPLREAVSYLSHEVELVVLTALAKDPRQRFASVEAFAAALGAVSQTTGRISALSTATAATKVLIADEEATSTMATDRVLDPLPVEVAAPGKQVQSGSAKPVAVVQTHPFASPEPVGVRSVLSKRKTTVAGLALILPVIALLLMYLFTSGGQPGVKHASVLAVSPTILSKPTIASTAVPPVEKTVAPQNSTVPQAKQPTVQPTTPNSTVPLASSQPTVQPTAPNSKVPSTASQPTASPPTPQSTVPLATPKPTVPPTTPTPVGVGSVRIDSGGSGSGSFGADEDFSDITPGRPSRDSNNASNVIDTGSVSNPAPQSVYQSFRVGDCLYTIPHLTPNASYTVRLHFAEVYWTQQGQRIFNVTLNGQVVLSNFDIIAAAGAANKAVVKQFVVQADSTGAITIQFKTVKDNAQINAIEVLAA
jgi:serine/threonine protein kinase